MKSIDNIKIKSDSTIYQALKIINNGSMKIAVVVNNEELVIGIVSDGDIRRALLNEFNLDSSIEFIITKNPTKVKIGTAKDEIIKIANSKRVNQILIVDDCDKVVGIEDVQDLITLDIKTKKVVLMVGGLGKRLRPLTESTPKPMLIINNKPILQIIIEQFRNYGYKDIIMCLNYKSNIIKDFFGDGSDFGVNIEYVIESKRLGTAGALSLLKSTITDSFFVMNGDIITSLNFEHLENFHLNKKSMATMCVKQYDFEIPYGVVNIVDEKIKSIEEKPLKSFSVNAGIYILNPETLEYIPNDKFFDMPMLFKLLISKNHTVNSFQLRQHWIDIGDINEYNKANQKF